MKNYYEILEVDMKASKEIIDKAFKVLAKRYHPDTQSEDKKKWAEEKFKEINEAYEILSNEEARSKYDVELDYDKNSVLEAMCLKNEHLQSLVDKLQNELEYLKNQNGYNYKFQNSQFNMHNNTYENINTTNESSYKNKYKKDYTTSTYTYSNDSYNNYNIPKQEVYYTQKKNRLKDLISFLITIACLIIIGFVLWKIPFTNKLLCNLYNDNPPIKAIVDFILNIFHN